MSSERTLGSLVFPTIKSIIIIPTNINTNNNNFNVRKNHPQFPLGHPPLEIAASPL